MADREKWAVPRTIRFPRELDARLEVAASREGRTRSAVVQDAVERYLAPPLLNLKPDGSVEPVERDRPGTGDALARVRELRRGSDLPDR